jgi:uncharacterized protein
MAVHHQHHGLRRCSAWLLCVLATIGLAALSSHAASAAPASPLSRTVTFTSDGGAILHGTVIEPVGRERTPGMVLVGGAGGPGRRAELLPEAEAFARGGVAAFVYDRRSGYSQFHRSYAVLADDALAALRVLRAQAGVDPARVGIWGQSEGAWVTSLAASHSSDVAFLVTVGAAGVSPAQQTGWNNAIALRHAGVSGSMLRTVQVTATRLAVGAGLFPEANYDPVPAWELVHQPVLALWGDDDQTAVPAESSRIIQSALARGGNDHYTIRFLPNASHSLHVSRNGGREGGSVLTAPTVTPLAAGYPGLVTSWIDRLAHGMPAASAQPAPRQAAPSIPIAQLRWYESPWVQLGAMALFLIAFGGHLIHRLVRRRSDDMPLRRPAAVLAVTGLVTAVGLFLYLALILLTGANVVGPVVVGRPLPWLLLQLTTLAALASTVAIALRSWKIRRDMPRAGRGRLGPLLAAGVALAPWAAYWGLLSR